MKRVRYMSGNGKGMIEKSALSSGFLGIITGGETFIPGEFPGNQKNVVILHDICAHSA